MGKVTDYAKLETLFAMYKSLDRMNRYIASGNTDGVVAEQHLQRNLRSNFEELSKS